MKKTILMVSSAFLYGAAVGVESYSHQSTATGANSAQHAIKKISPEKLRETIRKVQMKRTGGIVRETRGMKGTFVVLNAQVKVPQPVLTPVIATIEMCMHVQSKIVHAAKAPAFQEIQSAIKAAGGELGVVVMDNDWPTLTVMPENGYAVVDVGALSQDGPAPDILASRVRKEALRAFAFLTGAAYMARGEPLMRDIRTVKDLDAVPIERFGVETIAHVRESAPFYGLIPWRQATYKRACEEGWAPAPTNEYQKAIWDKVHEMPTAPIRILPETKKVLE